MKLICVFFSVSVARFLSFYLSLSVCVFKLQTWRICQRFIHWILHFSGMWFPCSLVNVYNCFKKTVATRHSTAEDGTFFENAFTFIPDYDILSFAFVALIPQLELGRYDRTKVKQNRRFVAQMQGILCKVWLLEYMKVYLDNIRLKKGKFVIWLQHL
jgi:hypothetical protein